jgi:hypothetical protein
MAENYPVIRLSPIVYARVTAIKKTLTAEKQRQVTYTEVVNELVECWEVSDRVRADIAKAGK